MPQEHTPDVFSNQPEEDHDHPREEPDGNHDGRPSDGCGRHEQFADEDGDGTDESRQRQDDAQVARHAQRHDAEAQDVRPEAQKAFERIAGLAVDPVEVFDRHTGDILRGPQEKPLHVGVLAFVLYDVIADELPDDPETGGFQILRFANQFPDGNVIHPAAEIAEGTVFLIRVVSVDDIVSLVKCIEEQMQLGRMGLHIVIHSDDSVAFRVVQSRHRSVVLAAVLGQTDGLDVRIILVESFDRCQHLALVRGAVIYEHEFKRHTAQTRQLFGCALDYHPDGF